MEPEVVDRIVREFDRTAFESGEAIVRRGGRAAGLYVVVEGEAAVVVDGEDRSRLGPGSCFGEVSVLLDEPAAAEVVARGAVSCVLIPAGAVERLLFEHGSLALALLRVEARRLQAATQWRT